MERAAQQTARRLFLNRFCERVVRYSPGPLLFSVAALSYVKVAAPTSGTSVLLGAAALAGLGAAVGSAFVSARRAARPSEGALALDRYHTQDDRLATALEFWRGAPSDEPAVNAWRELAIVDAVERSPALDPKHAAPLRRPRGLGILLGLVLGLGGLSLLEVQRHVIVPAPVPVPPKTSLLLEDDVELLRDMATELERQTETPEGTAALRRFNQLVEDVAEQRLDRAEAFRRLEALEKDMRGSSLEAEALEEGLKDMASDLERASLTKPAADALSKEQLEDAKQALRDLAKRLERKDSPPSKAELEQLRKSIEERHEQIKAENKQMESERQALEEERKRLLDKKKDGTATAADKDKLERTERRLEQLDRRSQKQKSAEQQLSELDQKLAEAARELMKEQGKSSEFMEQSARAVEKLQQKQMGQKEKEELLKRLQEMRDLLRQQKGQGQDKNYEERMRQLSQRARGGRQGKPGEGQGQPGQPGGAQPGPGRMGVQLGPDGQPIPMAGDGSGKPDQGKPGDGTQPGQGREPGEGHDPNVAGDTQSPEAAKTEAVSAVAKDTGEGTASSESIYGAAEKGFSSPDYKKIYTDYKTVSEDVIERESVPAGYRSYVRRYFQLIRPRE
jgi:hypothetical protein